ncbi:4-demethylwyosine synthase TYW1 [Candidatus Woesearchaeota archaeon]|nr:MAG: 4-demethylwyosine synthase TYW1 [Candidatus Woesearchaeota archaeon]
MLTDQAKKHLEKQAYRIVGSHSAVKTCGWTKKMIRGEGGCYKLKFYGIMSHQCMQMTTSISCANRCTFCWRGYKAPVSKDWQWRVDDPGTIIKESKKAHHDLLVGFKGSPTANKTTYHQSNTIKHVALSLTGEPIIYPKINEAIALFHNEGISTFLVTNAQYWKEIEELAPVTQLYLSIDAPNKELLKKIDKPLFDDYYERMLKSLDALAKKKHRTCIRLTLIKNMNMTEPENYAALIKRGDPDFIECKAYMFIGASRQRLTLANMPYHEEVVGFSQTLLNHLPNYDIVSEHIPSRVVLLAKKTFKKEDGWHTWIDFKRFTQLATSGKPFTTHDYLRKTPTATGISGRGTPKNPEPDKVTVVKEEGVSINEGTQETTFWQDVPEDDDNLI